MVTLKGPGFRTELREALSYAFGDYSTLKIEQNMLELIFSAKGPGFI